MTTRPARVDHGRLAATAPRVFQLPSEIADVTTALRALTIPWATAGGWAIDLALGRVTRSHHDVDVIVFRGDQATLRAELPAWTFDVVQDGVRVPWPADLRVDPPLFETFGWPANGDASSAVEFLLDDRDGDDWLYRRDPIVRRPLARALRQTPEGSPFLASEIVLLYKSKDPRAEDEHDFTVALELLDGEARAWLQSAMARKDSAHPWIARLADGERASTSIAPAR